MNPDQAQSTLIQPTPTNVKVIAWPLAPGSLFG
ncbi:hypothetical protein SAMN05216604_10228 [Pseudomonas agarici]|nr:hypothetical protein SAMN05216604_10228 [Pseudomonas agarici]